MKIALEGPYNGENSLKPSVDCNSDDLFSRKDQKLLESMVKHFMHLQGSEFDERQRKINMLHPLKCFYHGISVYIKLQKRSLRSSCTELLHIEDI